MQLSGGPQQPSWGGSFEPPEPPLGTGLREESSKEDTCGGGGGDKQKVREREKTEGREKEEQ